MDANDSLLDRMLDDVVEQIMNGALDEIAKARIADGMPCKTGRTMAAVGTAELPGSANVLAGQIFIDDTQVPYAGFLESGTGLFGPKNKEIVPTPKGRKARKGNRPGALKFSDGTFARSSKGSGKWKGFWSKFDWEGAWTKALDKACQKINVR